MTVCHKPTVCFRNRENLRILVANTNFIYCWFAANKLVLWKFLESVPLPTMCIIMYVLQEYSHFWFYTKLPGVSVSWGATGYTVSESQSVVELNLVIGGSTSYNSTLLISTLAGSATGACDYEKLCRLIATHNSYTHGSISSVVKNIWKRTVKGTLLQWTLGSARY